MRRSLYSLVLLLCADAHGGTVLIENVRIFDGVDETLQRGHVLVVDGLIDTISAVPIEAPDDATVIAGNDRVLTPGFIDLHVHLSMHSPSTVGREHATAIGACITRRIRRTRAATPTWSATTPSSPTASMRR